jgi:hypothetical protein
MSSSAGSSSSTLRQTKQQQQALLQKLLLQGGAASAVAQPQPQQPAADPTDVFLRTASSTRSQGLTRNLLFVSVRPIVDVKKNLALPPWEKPTERIQSGLFAARPIKAGGIALRDQYLVSDMLPDATLDDERPMAVQLSELNIMTPDFLGQVVDLRYEDPELLHSYEFQMVATQYQYPVGNLRNWHVALLAHQTPVYTLGGVLQRRALFELGCRINHSCSPNAIAVYPRAGNVCTVVALRPIAANEEITVCYFPHLLPFRLETRRMHIAAHETGRWLCWCERCMEEEFRMFGKTTTEEISKAREELELDALAHPPTAASAPGASRDVPFGGFDGHMYEALLRALPLSNAKQLTICLDRLDRARNTTELDERPAMLHVIGDICFTLTENLLLDSDCTCPEFRWTVAYRTLQCWLSDWEGHPSFSSEVKHERKKKLCIELKSENKSAMLMRALSVLFRGLEDAFKALPETAGAAMSVYSWLLLYALRQPLGILLGEMMAQAVDACVTDPCVAASAAVQQDWDQRKEQIGRIYKLSNEPYVPARGSNSEETNNNSNMVLLTRRLK